MSNLNVRDLRLVTPGRFNAEIASGVACWGKDTLNAARTFDTLSEAVADLHTVAGFASDSGRHRVAQVLLPQWVSTVGTLEGTRVGLVFGSEENGLGKDHFPLCQHLVRIPSSSENPSYNLAQSVLLALYSLRMNQPQHTGAITSEWATSEQLEQYTAMVLRVADRVGFLNDHSPSHIEDLISNVSRRGRLSVRELKILTGLFGVIDKHLRKT